MGRGQTTYRGIEQMSCWDRFRSVVVVAVLAMVKAAGTACMVASVIFTNTVPHSPEVPV